MKLTDQQLSILIDLGLTDEQILEFAHENTKPADLYGAVADVVTALLHGDADVLELIRQADPESALGRFAEKLEQFAKDELAQDAIKWWAEMGIDRSDTKKIVMTYLYGSTEFGNRDSINERIEKRAEECLEKQLDPYFDRSGADVWKEHRTKAVTVMVRLTRGAMAIVCPSTVEQMDTMQAWAERLGSLDIPYRVKSPLNFMMTQANPNMIRKEVNIYEDGKKVLTAYYKEPAEDGKLLNERKMKAGAAPNSTHLHDAAHLQDSTVRCKSEYYHHIHDSMGTQCADTPDLARCIRESLNWMYGDDEDGMPKDVMMDIYELNHGDENGLAEPKELGSLDLNDVMASHYFFS